MDPTRFDTLTKTVGQTRSRRTLLTTLGGAALAALTGGTRGTRAQGTPAAPPATVATAGLAANNSTLFVQTARSGTFRPNPAAASATPVTVGLGTPAPTSAAHGAYQLTLTGHSGETIAFSDRPQRLFGEVRTQTFFTSMGFTPANPPNAALVVDSPAQHGDILLVELLNPGYDAASQTLMYEANILQHYTGELLKPLAAKQQDQRIAAQFTSASLFIDDCPDADPLYCYVYDVCDKRIGDVGNHGMCWNWNAFECQPCDGGWGGTAAQCNAKIPACQGGCYTNPELPCENGLVPPQ